MFIRSPLLTDLYELTMAQAYWKAKMWEDEALFALFFRKAPFEGNYVVSSGLEQIIQFLEEWKFSDPEIAYLSQLKGPTGSPLFEPDFLSYLKDLKWECHLDAVQEGEYLFPGEPALRVQGPIIQAQLVETALLTLFNFSSLIATKAARICYAAGADPVIEFGQRRAQGIDGGITASRAAYIGGCSATSNTFAGMHFGIPVRGTQAHSWIMAFDDEQTAFETFGRVMPQNQLLLVDTYDSILGIEHAIESAKKNAHTKAPFLGIRLDSGDLCYLSQYARKRLDEEGFESAGIFASNELNEYIIQDLKLQGAKISAWGVGTHLVTGGNEASLGGVYKLCAIKRKNEKKWTPKIKFAENLSKTSFPNCVQVKRFFSREKNLYVGDALYNEWEPPLDKMEIIDPYNSMRKKCFSRDLKQRNLLIPIFQKGKKIYTSPSIEKIRGYASAQGHLFDPTVRRLLNPHPYPVGLEESYFNQKQQLMQEIQNKVHYEKKERSTSYC